MDASNGTCSQHAERVMSFVSLFPFICMSVHQSFDFFYLIICCGLSLDGAAVGGQSLEFGPDPGLLPTAVDCDDGNQDSHYAGHKNHRHDDQSGVVVLGCVQDRDVGLGKIMKIEKKKKKKKN